MDDHQDRKGNHSLEELPQVFDISKEGKRFKFTRRDFIKRQGWRRHRLPWSAVKREALAGYLIRNLPYHLQQHWSPPPHPYQPTHPHLLRHRPRFQLLTRTPTRTPTPTPIPVTCRTRTNGARFRAGPATFYQMMDGVKSGTVVTVIGRLADNSWLKVLVKVEDLPNLQKAPIAEGKKEVPGWFRADLLECLTGDISTLPEETPPPTPTALPNQAPTGDEGITYKYTDLYGNTYTYTLPCGSPIPEGAICTCNCVTLCSCDGYSAPCSCNSNSGGSYCTCNMVVYWYPN